MATPTAQLAGYIDLQPSPQSLEEAVLDGLARPEKAIPSKFLYDEKGSELFERICEQPEYYPTRTELAILRAHTGELARLVGPEAHVIELGAGALEKIRILLGALERPAHYTALDISGDHLRKAAETLAQDFPEVPVTAVCADYTKPFELSGTAAAAGERRVGFFPGSTIGNFTPKTARSFLAGLQPMFAPDGFFIVGVDLKKDPALLNAAYNDAAGVTAAFNLNLLRRINRELEADFDLNAFRHDAAYNSEKGRVEMHLESLADQTATVSGRAFAFAAGERIHTENSCKYRSDEFQALAREAGWRPVAVLSDPDSLFSLHVLAAS